MKRGWQTKTLGEICTTIQDGAHQSPKNQFESPGEDRFLYITSKNIRTNYLDLSNVSYVDREFHNQIYPRCKPRVGDVLLTKDGANTGNVALNTIGEPFSLLSSVCLIKTIPELLMPAFLCYYVQSPDGLKSITGQMTGAAIKRIILRDIKLAMIPLPTLTEQQRIVAILDQAFEAIAKARANAEANLKNARALFDSHLQSVFSQRGEGWVENTLENSVIKDCSLSYGIVQPGHEYRGGLPVVRPTDLVTKVIEAEGLKRIDPSLADSYRRTTLRGGDLLLCVRGSTGVVSVASAELAGANVTRGIVPISFDPALVCQDFGYYLMRSEVVQTQIREKTYGAALMQINIRDIRILALPLPPLKEQEALATTFDQLESQSRRLESLYLQKLEALDELKQSLLHQAFSGQL
ncbi:EcoKI restriction-modification system protein HsdS [mine drainage metagenome]|uniref:EcoKI restriction-modification system protein HsdS n=1 Tax=mine drainage metagenome TaxID=410659 RepID=A0A1J5T4J0_9ZZZZ